MAQRVLLLVTDLEIGGTPTVVRELAIRLNAPPAVQIEVACLAKWGPVADQLHHAGIVVTALGAQSIRDLSAIHRLIRLIREHRIDTLFSFLIHANVAASIAKLFSRDLRLIQSIQTTQPNPRWHWKLQAIVQYAADAVVVPSPSVAQVAMEWSDIPGDKIRIIPNAIDVANDQSLHHGVGASPTRSDISPPMLARNAAQPNSPKSQATIAVGFIGRLDRIKRVPDLVQAMSLLDDRFILHLFGDGADRTRIESEIVRLHLRNRVTMHGPIPKPQTALAQMDLLVLPSEAEGFGLVLIESMAARIPVVATDVPGIRDVVQNDRTGLLVPSARPDELAKAIRRISDDPALRSRLIASAYEDVKSRFNWPTVIQQYRQLLNLNAPTA